MTKNIIPISLTSKTKITKFTLHDMTWVDIFNDGDTTQVRFVVDEEMSKKLEDVLKHINEIAG